MRTRLPPSLHHAFLTPIFSSGPPCIYESVRRGKPLPDSKYPIYSRALEGLCITTTGFHARKKSDVETLIRFMGGGYAPDLTNRTDYLVASEVGSEKYFVACQRSIPIVRAEWLLGCWKEAALLSPHVRHSGFKLV